MISIWAKSFLVASGAEKAESVEKFESRANERDRLKRAATDDKRPPTGVCDRGDGRV